MIRRGGNAVLVLLLLAGLADSQNPNSSHLDDPRLRDVYAIYSLLMPGAVLGNLGPSQNQRWAVADTTLSIDDMNPALAPDAALKAPGGDEKHFQEALAAFNLLKHQREPLLHAFHLDRPYVLLNSDEVRDFQQARSGASVTGAETARFAGYPGIDSFSEVYFDSHRTAALVYQFSWCGNLCSQGEWIYLEKQNGQWVQRSGQAAIVSGAKPN